MCGQTFKRASKFKAVKRLQFKGYINSLKPSQHTKKIKLFCKNTIMQGFKYRKKYGKLALLCFSNFVCVAFNYWGVE